MKDIHYKSYKLFFLGFISITFFLLYLSIKNFLKKALYIFHNDFISIFDELTDTLEKEINMKSEPLQKAIDNSNQVLEKLKKNQWL